MTDLNTIKEFTEALRATETGTKPYDTTAEVIRTDGQTAWVHIPGGVDETPVQMSIDAKAGDSVNVRVSGGRAWITGNSSRPPTDDTVAHKANTTATEAQAVAEEAQETAEEASQIAQATKNYFWHDADGAHVSTVEGDASTGNNVLIDSNGMAIRDGETDLATFEADEISLGNNSTEAKIAFCKNIVNLQTEYNYIDDISPVNTYANFTAIETHDNVEVPDKNQHYTRLNLIARNGNDDVSVASAINLVASAEEESRKTYFYTDQIYINNIPLEQLLMPIRGAITNLNNATEYGIYTYENTASNKPNSAGGSLVVYKTSSTYWVQVAYPNNNNGNFTQYGRMHYSGGYGSWT